MNKAFAPGLLNSFQHDFCQFWPCSSCQKFQEGSSICKKFTEFRLLKDLRYSLFHEKVNKHSLFHERIEKCSLFQTSLCCENSGKIIELNLQIINQHNFCGPLCNLNTCEVLSCFGLAVKSHVHVLSVFVWLWKHWTVVQWRNSHVLELTICALFCFQMWLNVSPSSGQCLLLKLI